MNCDGAKGQMIAYLNGELTGRERDRIEEHVAMCQDCRREMDQGKRVLDWTRAASQEDVLKAVDEIIRGGIDAGASDIHLETQRDSSLLVRYRVDGVMHEARRLDSGLRTGVVTRVKATAEVNVAETQLPQDGRLRYAVEGREFDIRMSCVPFVFGENLVLRILDRGAGPIGFDRLGLSPDAMLTIQHIVEEPCGALFVTGPTGCGKTTTVYSLLKSVLRPEVKLMTIEDPVEYLLTGANQAQVNVRAGFTFAAAMRSFLRQDPDVIMLGEIRDPETAQLCMQAAITGHLVVSCLHTTTAVGAVQRLRDAGMESYLIGASMIGSIAQRLVRTICPDCKEATAADPREPLMQALGISEDELKEHTLYVGKGCEHCRQTGFHGRTAIFEVLKVDRELASMIATGVGLSEIEDAAQRQGFRTMLEDGKRKVLAGLTTAREVMRVQG